MARDVQCGSNEQNRKYRKSLPTLQFYETLVLPSHNLKRVDIEPQHGLVGKSNQLLIHL